MSTFREATTTIADFNDSKMGLDQEPRTEVRAKKLSGGATMWQARLVLSTLDPRSDWATRLRMAIRQGNETAADNLLDLIYARNSKAPEAPEPPTESMVAPASSSISAHTTVLPPSPHSSGRVA